MKWLYSLFVIDQPNIISTYITSLALQNMEEALTLFRQVYYQHHSIEEGIAELKRKGFSQMDTIRVLMEINAISVVKADEIVCNSAAWRS